MKEYAPVSVETGPVRATDPEALALRLDLAQALEAVRAAQALLVERLREEGRDGYPLWYWGMEDPAAARRELLRNVVQLEYDDRTTAAGASILHPALVGVSRETLAAVQGVNAARDRLAAALHAFDGLRVYIDDLAPNAEFPDRGRVKEDWRAEVLRRLHLKRFHKKLAVRHFAALAFTPASVSYSWTSVPKVVPIRVADLIAQMKASAVGDLLAKTQISVLETLPANELLARFSEPSEQPRANLVWEEAGALRRQQVYAAAPIFILSPPGADLPRLRPLAPAAAQRPARLARHRTKTETKPVLPGSRYFRYRDRRQAPGE